MYFRYLIRSILICLSIIGLTATIGLAHAYPDTVSPRDGDSVIQPPGEVRIKFTEGVELEFSRIDVKNAAGQKVTKGAVRRLAGDTLTIDLLPLDPGSYTIEWQVLSVDTHITQGVLRFTVKTTAK
jgi:methionine-rich copper-binding protein CopC